MAPPPKTDLLVQDRLRPLVGSSGGLSKMRDHHLDRLAVVYVRQSTARQVLEHQESTRLQYQLADRAEALGWRKDRIVVIDDDLGKSGASAEQRTGFQRLLADVSLDHVGLVLGIEMSRLARSCKDWHQLLELCALFRCLLADQDGLYDPGDYNDRLLLGLKGTMSEAELHILKGRMQQGSWNKARRAELITHMPLGYQKLPDGSVVMEPDEQVHSVVRMVFQKFEELGSAMAVIRYFRTHQIRLPFRVSSGVRKGQLEWRDAKYTTIASMIRNPTYSGAYTFGRYQQDPKQKIVGDASSGRFLAPLEEWKVIVPDRFPAYITWDQYRANIAKLRQNRSQYDTKGIPRDGNALLAGILICGRCGRRMQPHYKPNPDSTAYMCCGQYPHAEKTGCQRLIAEPLHDLVVSLTLNAIAPAALHLSLESAERVREERLQLHRLWEQRRERAGYQAALAQRQYEAVDPENRLVARELERRWEQALSDQRNLNEEFDRFQREQPKELSAVDLKMIEELSTNLPCLWNSSTTSNSDRQMIVRHLIEKVAITVQGTTELADVSIHWAGGYVSQHQVLRAVAAYEQLCQFDEMKALIESLWRTGHTTPRIAEQLNARGFRTPTRRSPFSRHMVRKLLDKWGLTEPQRAQVSAENAQLGPDEWWLTDLARQVHADISTLARWCRWKWIHSRRIPDRCKWWVAWADADELERIKRLLACSKKSLNSYPPELKSPRPRPSQ